MNYLYQKEMDGNHRWKDSTGKEWSYRKLKTGPVFGDVQRNGNYATNDYLIDGEEKIEVGAVHKKLGLLKQVTGYLPCKDELGESGCVRIIGWAWKRIIAAIVLLVIVLSVIFLLLLQQQKPKDMIEDFAFPKEMQNNEEGKVYLPDYTLLEKNEGDEVTTTWLYNVEGNSYALQYIVHLKEGNQTLYESEILQPGQAICGFTPWVDLKEGSYSYEMEVRMYALDDLHTPVSVQTFEGNYVVYGK